MINYINHRLNKIQQVSFVKYMLYKIHSVDQTSAYIYIKTQKQA